MFGSSKFGKNFNERSYHNFNFVWISPENLFFFEGSSWFKFNNLELAACMTLKFYRSVTKGLKLRVRKFLGKTPKFEKLTEENLARGLD